MISAVLRSHFNQARTNDGNSNTCRSKLSFGSGRVCSEETNLREFEQAGEIIGILKKIKDADPADSQPCARVERAPEEHNRRTQEQIVAVKVTSRIDEG